MCWLRDAAGERVIPGPKSLYQQSANEQYKQDRTAVKETCGVHNTEYMPRGLQQMNIYSLHVFVKLCDSGQER